MRALAAGVGFVLGLGVPILLFGLTICVLSLVQMVRG